MHVDDSVVAEAKQAGKERPGGVPEALRQLLTTVRVHLKLDGFLEALKAILLSTEEKTSVDVVVMFTRQDGSVECVNVRGGAIRPCVPECVLRHMRPLLLMVSEGHKHATTLRLAPWRAQRAQPRGATAGRAAPAGQ